MTEVPDTGAGPAQETTEEDEPGRSAKVGAAVAFVVAIALTAAAVDAAFVLTIGGAITAGVLAYVAYKRQMTVTKVAEAPPTWLDDPDDWRWQTEAEEAAHTNLATIRTTATSWAGSVSALLGIFGTVAVVKGPDAFKDIGTPTGWYVLGLLVGATALAGTAVIFAAIAAQGTPHRLDRADGWALKWFHGTRAYTSFRYLLISRLLCGLAAVAVFAGLIVTWVDGLTAGDAPTSQHALVIAQDGTASCIELKTDATGKLVGVSGAAQVTPVDSCPKP